MKCLVFSDSHNFSTTMRKALFYNKDTEVVFFLGDGISDLDEIQPLFPNVKFLAVRGNCDFRFVFSERIVQKTEEITLCSKKIVFTHGDLYGAKYGTAGLERLANEKSADIVLFGHTHIPCCSYFGEGDKPFYLFNPGSASYREGSFGIITLSDNAEPLFSHGNLL